MSLHTLAYTRRNGFHIDYGLEIENEIVRIQNLIDENPAFNASFPSRWLALKLLEQDPQLTSNIRKDSNQGMLLNEVQKSVNHLRDIFGDDPEVIIADRRYGWINGLVHEIITRKQRPRRNLTEQIDRIVLNRVLGIPIFLGMMWLVFKITTDFTTPFVDWIDHIFHGPVNRLAIALFSLIGLEQSWLSSLFIDGVIAGVGGVLVFVPVLIALYIVLAILEDCGYMARAAFVTDRLMHLLGLHGKSFLPMIVGFGCTVPALFATRTLDNEHDRILTGLMVPFISCGARLPIYVLLAGAFFPDDSGGIIFFLYVLGIVTALGIGVLFKTFLFNKKEKSPFVMELPPYRLPTLRGIWMNVQERVVSFVNKAFTVILLASIVIWILLAVPVNSTGNFAQVSLQESLFARLSGLAAPVFSPLGFGTWQTSGALLAGILGKEIIVSTMAQVHGIEEITAEESVPANCFEEIIQIGVGFIDALKQMGQVMLTTLGVQLPAASESGLTTTRILVLQQSFNASSQGHGRLAALAFMVFALSYTPCLAALVAERAELGTRWMFISAIGQFVVAWLLGFLVYQGGLLLNIL